MQIWRYKNELFPTQDDAWEYVAENAEYVGEEGLMNICENDVEYLDDFDGVLEFCEYEGYTLREVMDVFDDIDWDTYWMDVLERSK